jgi:hypothetical protein
MEDRDAWRLHRCGREVEPMAALGPTTDKAPTSALSSLAEGHLKLPEHSDQAGGRDR